MGPVRAGERIMTVEEELSRERQKFQAIQQIARAVGSTLDIDELLRLIVSTVTEQMGAERSSLFVLTDDGSELWTRVLEADEVQEIRLEVGTGVAGWVAQAGEAVNIPDAYQDPRFSSDIDQKTGYRTRSILCVPMTSPLGQTTGVLQVLNKREGTFSDDDQDLLLTLASQAAMAVENSKLYQSVVRKNQQLLTAQTALERRMRERDLLLEMQQQVNAATFLDELLERLLARTTELVGAQAAGILLRDVESGRLFFRSALGERGEQVRKVALEPGQGIAGWVTLHGKPAVVNDPAADPRHSRDIAKQLEFRPRNILCVPLIGQDEVLGAIELLNKVGRDSFDEDDERLLSLIAGSIAQAIELARYKEQRIQESRLASIGQMLSGVLHDLKTPMTVISGYAQLMAQNDSQEVRQEYVDQILRQFEVMAAMTREVLAFARGESNVLIRKVYLHKFVAEIKQHLAHEMAGKNVELVVDMPYRGAAFFDEKKFRRVFHNIARNAVQAMPDGGTFTITVAAGDDKLVLSFADTGVGVPEELTGSLFEAFATAGKPDGTGLGLAIVKKIVEEHHGTIEYDSVAGQGTTFSITLPLSRPNATGEVSLAAAS